MKLNIEQNRSQGDPYVIKVKEKYYMYCTHNEGVHLYSSKDKIDWEYRGICFTKVDEKGKVNVSRKALLPKPVKKEEKIEKNEK